MQKFTLLAASIAASALVTPVHAAPIKFYDMTLTVATSTTWGGVDCTRPPQNTNVGIPGLPPSYMPHWGCVKAGDVYSGRIGIDTDVIGWEGKFSRTGGPSFFELEFGRLILGKGYKADGFHYTPGFASGGCDLVWHCTTYQMKDGELTGLFVSAFLTGDSASILFDLDGRFSGGNYGLSFAGDMTLTAVSEPETLLLFAIALVSAYGVMRRRNNGGTAAQHERI